MKKGRRCAVEKNDVGRASIGLDTWCGERATWRGERGTYRSERGLK